MLNKVSMAKQISVTVINEIGVLDIMARYLAERGINIEAIAGYEIPGSDNAKIMLVVDDTRRTIEALKKRDFGSIEENDVIMLELDNKPGALKTITGVLTYKAINIRSIYATTSRDTWYVKVILSTRQHQGLCHIERVRREIGSGHSAAIAAVIIFAALIIGEPVAIPFRAVFAKESNRQSEDWSDTENEAGSSGPAFSCTFHGVNSLILNGRPVSGINKKS
jgi:hypothetical protein